jgi:uncharacterized protein with HEPN domain
MSTLRDDSVYLNHIVDSGERVRSYIEGVSEAEFMATPLIQDAVMRQIQIIGEAASRLSSDFRTRTGFVPWKDVVGMRHKLVHDYMGVDLEAVWATAARDIPSLMAELSKLK